ncbi:MAG TPA: hypothetical protein VGM64_03620 [Lacunisphaera sp.]|jgi:hypothetical protein
MKTFRHFLKRVFRRAAVSTGILLWVCGSAKGGEAASSTASDGRSPWKITEDFHYTINPPPSASGYHSPDDGAEILTLEKLVVTQHNGARILEKLFADQARIHAEESFSWDKGGIVHESANKRVVTKFIYKADTHTIDLLSLPW